MILECNDLRTSGSSMPVSKPLTMFNLDLIPPPIYCINSLLILPSSSKTALTPNCAFGEIRLLLTEFAEFERLFFFKVLLTWILIRFFLKKALALNLSTPPYLSTPFQ
jgi:hypothetical protein